MSWNIGIRLNNMQQQINNIANKGLVNPLEENIQGNNFNINEINNITANGDISCSTLKTNISSGVTIQASGVECTTIECDSINCQTDISCNTLNYENLNPPISGVSETISKVLQNGNNAEGQTIIGLENLTIGNYVYVANGSALGDNTTSAVALYNNNGENAYKLTIGDPTGSIDEIYTFKISDLSSQEYLRIDNSAINQITLSSNKLLYKQSSTQPPSATGYILDTYKQMPAYKQIFSNVNQSISLNINSSDPSYLFGCNIYDGDTIFNYGITYSEILFSYLQINFTSDDPFLAPNNCQLYLGPTSNYSFDPSKGNRIVFSVLNNSSDQPNYTFNSSVPIILYYQNGDSGSSFDNLYLNIAIQDQQLYNVTFSNTNFVVSSYVCGKLTDPLAWNT